MKSNPVAAVGIAFVDLPLPIEPHLLFRISCAEMESGTGAALARPDSGTGTPEPVHPWAITRSAPQWHCPVLSIDLLLPSFEIPLAGSSIAVEPLPKKHGSGGPAPTLVPLWRARKRCPAGSLDD